MSHFPDVFQFWKFLKKMPIFQFFNKKFHFLTKSRKNGFFLQKMYCSLKKDKFLQKTNNNSPLTEKFFYKKLDFLKTILLSLFRGLWLYSATKCRKGAKKVCQSTQLAERFKTNIISWGLGGGGWPSQIANMLSLHS